MKVKNWTKTHAETQKPEDRGGRIIHKARVVQTSIMQDTA